MYRRLSNPKGRTMESVTGRFVAEFSIRVGSSAEPQYVCGWQVSTMWCGKAKDNVKCLGTFADEEWMAVFGVFPSKHISHRPAYVVYGEVDADGMCHLCAVRHFCDETVKQDLRCDKLPAVSLLRFLGADDYVQEDVQLWSTIKVATTAANMLGM